VTASAQIADEFEIIREGRFAGVHRRYRAYQRPILGVAGILMVLIPWELLVRLGMVKAILISSPSEVARTFVTEIGRGTLWGDIWATVSVWLLGFTIAAIAGILIGLAAGWFKRASYVAVPWLNVLYAAPELAFIPMFILWLGIGVPFKVWIVFLACVFQVSLNTIAGVHATEARFVEVAKTYGASGLTLFRTVVLPGSVPYIMTGLRQGAGRAVVGAVAAEFISSNQGIGFLISLSGQTLQTSRVFVGIILLATLGIVTGEILGRVEKRFDVWRREATA
jgi:ABC-type nitrate/sulfonate/bicarbonate transport system permease component